MIALFLAAFVGFVAGVVLTDRKPEIAEHLVDELVKATTREDVQRVLARIFGAALVVALCACHHASPAPPDANAGTCTQDARVLPCTCGDGSTCETAVKSDACVATGRCTR